MCRRFFHGWLEDESDGAFVRSYVDSCFWLAEHFGQHPDRFLDIPMDDLPFYVDSLNRRNRSR